MRTRLTPTQLWNEHYKRLENLHQKAVWADYDKAFHAAYSQTFSEATSSRRPPRPSAPPTNFPCIVRDDDCSTRGLIADNILTHGHAFAAQQARKQGLCFTLFYFLAFGRAPRHTLHQLPALWAPSEALDWDLSGSVWDQGE